MEAEPADMTGTDVSAPESVTPAEAPPPPPSNDAHPPNTDSQEPSESHEAEAAQDNTVKQEDTPAPSEPPHHTDLQDQEQEQTEQTEQEQDAALKDAAIVSASAPPPRRAATRGRSRESKTPTQTQAHQPKRKSGRGAAAASASNTSKSNKKGNSNNNNSQALAQSDSGAGLPPTADIDWRNKTRCSCGQEEDSFGIMVACDVCESWQHAACMGAGDEAEIPDQYACPWCRPDMHPLGNANKTNRKQSRSRTGRSSNGTIDSKQSHSPPSLATESAHLPTHAHNNNSSSNNNNNKQGSAAPLSGSSHKAPANHSKPPSAPSSSSYHQHHAQPSHEASSKDTSPATSTAAQTAKEIHDAKVRRRSTMNSRDAAYEANLAEALRLSKAAAGINEPSPRPDFAAHEDEDVKHHLAQLEQQQQQQQQQLQTEEGGETTEPNKLPTFTARDPSETVLGQAGADVPMVAEPEGMNEQSQQLEVPPSDRSRSASEAAAVSHGKRRREASEEGHENGQPESSSKRRMTESHSPGFDAASTPTASVFPPSQTETGQASEQQPQAQAGNSTAVPDITEEGAEQAEVADADAMDVAASGSNNNNNNSKKSNRGGNRRGGGGGGGGGGNGSGAKGAAAKRGAKGQAGEQQEDDDGMFTRHGSNQYASRLKPIPRSKISPHKRPPIQRAGQNGHHQNHRDDDFGQGSTNVQTLPDHLSHLSHLVPAENIQGPGQDSPFATEGGHTRIRFPGRRMTMPEMRKRTKAMLDYLARTQVEMAERDAKRSRGSTPSGSHTQLDASESERKSVGMMDGLTREIIRFQERFVNTGP